MIRVNINTSAAINELRKKKKFLVDSTHRIVGEFVENTEIKAKNKLISKNSLEEGEILNDFYHKKSVSKRGIGRYSVGVDNIVATFIEFGTSKKFRKLNRGDFSEIAERTANAAIKARPFVKFRVERNIKKGRLAGTVKNMDALLGSMARNGISPRPFFYRAAKEELILMRAKLKRLVRRL